MSKLLYRVDEVALKLSISCRTVYRLIEEGELLAHNRKTGKKGLRIVATSIETYIEKNQVESK